MTCADIATIFSHSCAEASWDSLPWPCFARRPHIIDCGKSIFQFRHSILYELLFRYLVQVHLLLRIQGLLIGMPAIPMKGMRWAQFPEKPESLHEAPHSHIYVLVMNATFAPTFIAVSQRRRAFPGRGGCSFPLKGFPVLTGEARQSPSQERQLNVSSFPAFQGNYLFHVKLYSDTCWILFKRLIFFTSQGSLLRCGRSDKIYRHRDNYNCGALYCFGAHSAGHSVKNRVIWTRHNYREYTLEQR